MKLAVLDKSHSKEIIDLVQLLNPNTARDVLEKRYEAMLEYPTYRCFGLKDDSDRLLAVSSGWITTRFYSGKQLELDAVVIHPDERSKGLGSQFEHMLMDWAKANDCLTMELNSYVSNHRSHKFHLNQGYAILGYHFLKKMDGSDFSR